MTWLIIKAFFGRALGKLLEAIRWLVDHPWQAALIVAVVAAGWQYRGKQHALSDLAKCQAHSASLEAAITSANKLAKEARAKSETIAKEVDRDHEKRIQAGRVSTDNYVRAHRLRADQGSVSAPAEDPNTGVPASPSAEAIVVAVSEADVRTCAADYEYARSAFDWVERLKRDGLAD